MPVDSDSVSKVVITWKKSVLFLERQDGKGWELPGGHLNIGEKFVKGAKREVFEETGIKLTKLRVLLKQKDFCLFHAIPKVLKVKLSNEHTGYKWLNKRQILKQNITKATKWNLKVILNAID